MLEVDATERDLITILYTELGTRFHTSGHTFQRLLVIPWTLEYFYA